MENYLYLVRSFGYQIKWWDHPAGWSITDIDDELVVSGLSDYALEQWFENKYLEFENEKN